MSSKRKKIKKKNKNFKKTFYSDVIKTSFCLQNDVGDQFADIESDSRLQRVEGEEFEVVSESGSELIAFDEHLLDRARTQWQFGDWESLAQLQRDALVHHPDRAKLALLTAAGNVQCGSLDKARQFVRLAQEWGCGKQLVSRILISGVYNSLGRVALTCNQQSHALKHFENALSIGTPGSDLKLLTKARSEVQITQLRLSTDNGHVVPYADELALGKNRHSVMSVCAESLTIIEMHEKWQEGDWVCLAKIDNADLGGRSNRADLALYAACGYQQLDDVEGLQRCTRLAREWGCPSEKVRKFLAAGIQNTVAVSQVLAGQYESSIKHFVASLRVDQNIPETLIIKNRVSSQIKNLRHLDIEQVFDAITKHLV